MRHRIHADATGVEASRRQAAAGQPGATVAQPSVASQTALLPAMRPGLAQAIAESPRLAQQRATLRQTYGNPAGRQTGPMGMLQRQKIDESQCKFVDSPEGHYIEAAGCAGVGIVVEQQTSEGQWELKARLAFHSEGVLRIETKEDLQGLAGDLQTNYALDSDRPTRVRALIRCRASNGVQAHVNVVNELMALAGKFGSSDVRVEQVQTGRKSFERVDIAFPDTAPAAEDSPDIEVAAPAKSKPKYTFEEHYGHSKRPPARAPAKRGRRKGLRSRLCFITTACIRSRGLDDDCEELTVLRHFRDTYLCSVEGGEAMIDEYYRVAPAIVAAIDRDPAARQIYDDLYRRIVRCVNDIKSGRDERAMHTYKAAVEALAWRFGIA